MGAKIRSFCTVLGKLRAQIRLMLVRGDDMGAELMAQSGRALSVSPAGHSSIPEVRYIGSSIWWDGLVWLILSLLAV
jgi:hypothetical protein